MKRNLLIIFASVFFAFSLSAQTFEGKGFASPEKAVKEYLNAIKECDYDKIVSCYAIESYVKKYDVEQFIKRLNCATVTMQMIYPKDNFLNQIGINLASKNRSRISAWL